MSQRQLAYGRYRRGSSNDEYTHSQVVLSEADLACWKEYANTPDQSKGDFFCKACSCRVSTIQMWNSHVGGKKHLKSITRGPLERIPKVKTIPCKERSTIEQELDEMEEPIVGLDYVRETKRSNRAEAPFYSCFLCHATLPTQSVLDHLVSTKHRQAYFEKEDPKFAENLANVSLSKIQLDSLIENNAAKMEVEKGRGKIEVYREKPKGTVAFMPVLYEPPRTSAPRGNTTNQSRPHIEARPSTSRSYRPFLPRPEFYGPPPPPSFPYYGTIVSPPLPLLPPPPLPPLPPSPYVASSFGCSTSYSQTFPPKTNVRDNALGSTFTSAASTSESAPSTSKSAPSTSKLAPSTSKSAPSTSELAPSTSELAPSTSESSTFASESSASASKSSASASNSSASASNSSASASNSSASASNSSASASNSSATASKSIASTFKSVASTFKSVASTFKSAASTSKSAASPSGSASSAYDEIDYSKEIRNFSPEQRVKLMEIIQATIRGKDMCDPSMKKAVILYLQICHSAKFVEEYENASEEKKKEYERTDEEFHQILWDLVEEPF